MSISKNDVKAMAALERHPLGALCIILFVCLCAMGSYHVWYVIQTDKKYNELQTRQEESKRRLEDYMFQSASKKDTIQKQLQDVSTEIKKLQK